jgi:hypothetical protein
MPDKVLTLKIFILNFLWVEFYCGRFKPIPDDFNECHKNGLYATLTPTSRGQNEVQKN